MLPRNAELLGFCNDDRPIVAYHKDSIRFISESEKDAIAKGQNKGKA